MCLGCTPVAGPGRGGAETPQREPGGEGLRGQRSLGEELAAWRGLRRGRGSKLHVQTILLV